MNGEAGNAIVANGGLRRPAPHPIHYGVIAVMVGAIFMLDVLTPLGIADWLLYVIPIGYAVRYVRRGRHPRNLLREVWEGPRTSPVVSPFCVEISDAPRQGRIAGQDVPRGSD